MRVGSWVLNAGQLAAAGYVVCWLLASAVRALPAPEICGRSSSLFYLWLYGFCHALGANWGHVRRVLALLACR